MTKLGSCQTGSRGFYHKAGGPGLLTLYRYRKADLERSPAICQDPNSGSPCLTLRNWRIWRLSQSKAPFQLHYEAGLAAWHRRGFKVGGQTARLHAAPEVPAARDDEVNSLVMSVFCRGLPLEGDSCTLTVAVLSMTYFNHHISQSLNIAFLHVVTLVFAGLQGPTIRINQVGPRPCGGPGICLARRTAQHRQRRPMMHQQETEDPVQPGQKFFNPRHQMLVTL